jgi:hypothetical protein
MRFIFLVFSVLIGNALLAQKLPNRQLILGSGGGVTGQVTSYIFLEDGRLFRLNSLKPDSLVLVRTIFASTAQKYFSNASKLALAKKKFNKPGNLSFFVRLKTTSTKQEEVQWGQAKAIPPKDVKAFYDGFFKNIVPKE